MKRRLPLAALSAALSAVPAHAQPTESAVHSRLWGDHGERWDPAGRLPDFSFAGYGFGDRPIPEPEPTRRVTEFGAVPGDGADDTDAFRDAIDAAASSPGLDAVLVPRGRYIISDILWIKSPGVVLRGEGPEHTELRITTTLEDVRPNMGQTTSGRPTSNYSWSGGFIRVRGSFGDTPAASITRGAARGAREIRVGDPSPFDAGDRVLVQQSDDAGDSLAEHLYGGQPGDTSRLRSPLAPRLIARIESIDGRVLTLNRPLRWDVRAGWSPLVRRLEPSVHDVGVESMTISFPATPYGGHFTERGRNAIAMTSVIDCWVRDVTIRSADSGIFMTGFHSTIEGVRIESERAPHNARTGHHGVTLGSDNLLRGFAIETRFIHDITLTRLSAGNVVKDGRGENLSLDHHKRGNHANLWTDLDAGAGTDLWRCGGGRALGRNAGARTTFWNIRSDAPKSWPRPAFGPDLMTLIGITTRDEAVTDPDGRWFEPIEPRALRPQDLHSAQLEARGGRDAP